MNQKDNCKSEIRYGSVQRRLDAREEDFKRRRDQASPCERARKSPGTKPRRLAKTPMTRKPAAFYVPRNLDLNLYPKDLRCSISFVLNTIHWKFCCKKADD